MWTHITTHLKLHYSDAILSEEQAEHVLVWTMEFMHKIEDDITLDFLFNQVK